MIRGIGIDVASLDRVQAILEKEPRFVEKVLTPSEIAIFNELSEHRKVEFLAGRFSVKESFVKAWGTGFGEEISFQDIETLTNELGKPITHCHLYDGNIFSSISHDAGIVVTQVILEDK
ncbi:MAG: holo-ACP synthase [Lactobacillus sp.]|nr:holo-ACP synthase [Lactobacillus sp.]